MIQSIQIGSDSQHLVRNSEEEDNSKEETMWEWVKRIFGFDGHKQGRYYVYELRDPRFSPARTFYVGKGTEDRIYQHVKDMRRLLKRGRAGIMHMQPKHKRILEIIDDGYEVIYVIIFRTDIEEEAYQVESRRIEHYGLEKLSNETYGYNSAKVRARRAAGRKKAS